MRHHGHDREEQFRQQAETRVAFVHVAGLYWTFFQYHLQVCAKRAGAVFIDRSVTTASEQIAEIEALLSEDIAVLLVHPMVNKYTELMAVLQKAKCQGIHLISIDGMQEESIDMCSVTGDNFGGQAALAEYVFKRLGGEGKIAYLQGDLRTEAGELRDQGLLSVLARYPRIELAFTARYDWSSSDSDFRQGIQMGRAALQAHPDLVAIISTTDEGALGVNAVTEEMGLRGKILLAGFDGTPEGITALSSGALEATARQPLEVIAQETVNLALDLATGRVKTSSRHVYPIELVTRDTIADAAMKALRIFPEVTEDLNKRGIEQKNSAAFLEALLDNMPAMLVVKDARTLNYTRVNKAREAWLNASRETQLGKSAFDFYSEKAAAAYHIADRKVLKSGRPVEVIEELLVGGDSELRYMLTRKIPILDSEGKPDYLMIISEDITPEINAKRALAKHTEELENANHELTRNHEKLLQAEKMAALGALVAGVAHELNTPIGNAVLAASTYADHTRSISRKKGAGLTRAMLAGYLTDAREGLAIMERNLHRATELIQSFRQIAVDQASAQARSFFLDTLVAETLLALSPSLKKLPIEVQRDVPSGILMDSYPGPLEQVLMNLVDNAVSHAFDGRPRGLIKISASTPTPGWVEVVVQDNGVGIPPENLRRIYDPFFTTKLGSGGAGLGLSVSRNIVTNVLGGSIQVNSAPNAGTRFEIALPLQAGQAGVGPHG